MKTTRITTRPTGSRRSCWHPNRIAIIITLATLAALQTAALAPQHDLRSVPDEEIIIEPERDYGDPSADKSSSHQHQPVREQSNGVITTSPSDPNKLTEQQSSSSSSSSSDNNDLFAITFEDYYREARQQAAANDSSQWAASSAIPDATELIIEDEDNSVKRNEFLQPPQPPIDFIFPPSASSNNKLTSPNQHKQQSEQSESSNQLHATHEHETNNRSSNAISNEPLDDKIRLLFSWKQILTNKCSKSCGKGFRVYHLYCIDLKYQVRVEDELCVKSRLPKPNETSDEPCNEIDCPPHWSSKGFRECSGDPLAGKCQLALYERVQCIMVNGAGISIPVDDTKCNTTKDDLSSLSTPAAIVSKINKHVDDQQIPTNRDMIDLESASEELTSNNNDVVLSVDTGSDEHSLTSDQSFRHHHTAPGRLAPHKTVHHPSNEPFFEPGNWSECSGAACGELGRRRRKVSCRIYLSRSSRFAELPDSSCHGISSPAPDTEEPCYMDCIPQHQTGETTSHTQDPATKSYLELSPSYTVGENTDETVYDLEMSRFVWRREGWTKCSADCLGGKRESIIECWDKIAQTLVDQSLCMEELKPKIVTETCNEVPCAPEWRLEPFSKCTRPCGSAGIRTRSIACVQQVPMREGSSSTLIVSNDLCIQSNNVSMPHQLEPCNRIDCRPEWKVSPWSECSKRCGHGIKNRTVICVQEFAHKDGPTDAHLHRTLSPDLREAITISASDWHPAKATQVPFHECYKEYKTVPALDERCFNFCEEQQGPQIDADAQQDYRMTLEMPKRRTITLKIGGKAQVIEGRNLKIRCRVMNRVGNNQVRKKVTDQVEWRKDGVRIFSNGSTVADKQIVADDNLVLGGDVFSDDDRNQFMADEPALSHKTTRSTVAQSRARSVRVRSSSGYSYMGNFQFVPQAGGRFSLVKENTLRIKRLKPDDSGSYSCSYGNLMESLELDVVDRRQLFNAEEKLANNLSM